jgi:hypothetical protein
MSTKTTLSNPQKTVLIITVGFLVLFFISKQNWMLYVSMSIGILGASSSFLAEKIDWVWTKIGWILSFIVPNVIMTLVFYFVLLPTAILSRLFGKKDLMDLENNQQSLWKTKSILYSKESFEKPW